MWQRVSLTEWCLTMKCGWSKGENWIPPCGKNVTHWHSLTLAECLWRPNSRCEHSKSLNVAFQLGQIFMSTMCRLLFTSSKNAQQMVVMMFCSWEFALSNNVIVLVATVVVSMEINRRHYFWSNPCICGPEPFLFTQYSSDKPKGWIAML